MSGPYDKLTPYVHVFGIYLVAHQKVFQRLCVKGEELAEVRGLLQYLRNLRCDSALGACQRLCGLHFL